MFHSKTKFLATEHTNEFDRIAKRALEIDAEIARLQQNAYNAGNAGGMEACQRGRSACLAIFAIAYKERRYGFGTDVCESIAAIAASFPTSDDPLVDAGDLLAGIELGLPVLREALPVVATVSCKGVSIVRGFHAQLAMQGVVAENDNKQPA